MFNIKKVFLSHQSMCFRVQQEDGSSCLTGRHAFSHNTKTCLLVEQEDMSSCRVTGLLFRQGDASFSSAIRHVTLSSKKTCPLVEQGDMSSCGARGSAFVFDKNTHPRVQYNDVSCFPQEYMPSGLQQVGTSSGRTRRRVFLFAQKMRLPVEQGGMSFCRKKRRAFLLDNRKRLLVEQEAQNNTSGT